MATWHLPGYARNYHSLARRTKAAIKCLAQRARCRGDSRFRETDDGSRDSLLTYEGLGSAKRRVRITAMCVQMH